MSDRHEFHERMLKEKTMKTFKEEFFEYLQKLIHEVSRKDMKGKKREWLDEHQGRIDILSEMLDWYKTKDTSI